MRAAVYFLALVMVAVLIAGCAPPSGPGPELDTDREAAMWQSFRSGEMHAESPQAFSLTCSLNYSGPDQQNRVVVHFWGNADYPLRMDLQAGVGTIFTYWREAEDGFIAYVPEEQAAYLHDDGKLGMAAFGFTFPFSLQELAQFLLGRVHELLPEEYNSAQVLEDGTVEYTFIEQGKRFTVLLDAEGRPMELTSPDIPPWEMEIRTYLDDAGLEQVPERIRIVREPEEKIMLLVKSFAFKTESWAPGSLDLELPPGTELRRLLNQ
ncbi:MAG: hypothetical protein D6E12_11170 [Desulfovibrio sp.]|nr:MAG: hypothetical protein D6E12_11170 [Desulfovibrio sp.]